MSTELICSCTDQPGKKYAQYHSKGEKNHHLGQREDKDTDLISNVGEMKHILYKSNVTYMRRCTICINYHNVNKMFH